MIDLLMEVVKSTAARALHHAGNPTARVTRVQVPVKTMGTYHYRDIVVPNTPLLYDPDQWCDWPEFRRLTGIVKGDVALAALFGSYTTSVEWALGMSLSDLLGDFLVARWEQPTVSSEMALHQVCRAYCLSLYENTVHTAYYAPVYCCEWEDYSGPVTLGHGCDFLLPSDSDLGRVVLRRQSSSIPLPMSPPLYYLRLVQEEQLMGRNESSHSYVNELFHRITAALRVQCGGHAYIYEVMPIRPKGEFKGSMPSAWIAQTHPGSFTLQHTQFTTVSFEGVSTIVDKAYAHAAVSEMLEYMGDIDMGYHELYKVWEVIRDDCGGQIGATKRGYIEKSRLRKLTANLNAPALSGRAARHARSQGEPGPSMAMDANEVYVSVRDLARAWTREKA